MTEAMRILLVSHVENNADAGASRVYHLLEQGLRSRGHFVRTLHYEDFRISRPLRRAAGRLFLPYVASRSTGTVRPEEYDVIMSSSGMLYPLWKRLRKNATHPLLVSHVLGLSFFDYQAIVTERMRGHLTTTWWNRLITGPLPSRWDELGSRYADITIVPNRRDLDFLNEKGISPVSYIPLSVHPEISEAGSLAPIPEERDPQRLLWFGSWVERKGIYYIGRTLELVLEKFPNVRLTLGATGTSESYIRPFFPRSTWSKIDVLPRISRLEQIAEFSRNSIFLFPSLSEGFGYAVLEAMAMGLAVVTTQTGFGGDRLTDGLNARLVPMASATHLADAVVGLMQSPQLRCKIAAGGQRLSRLFGTDQFVAAYETLFRACVERGSRHA